MHKRFINPVLALSAALLLLAGCSGSLFGGPKPAETRKPENSTEYQCAGGKHFFVRMLDKGNAAWLIYPEREVNLDKMTGGTGTRYSNGVAVLEINGAEATLNDGPGIAYTGCKVPTGK
jgi:membrane-bound inhibitor of C-type lysozyme